MRLEAGYRPLSGSSPTLNVRDSEVDPWQLKHRQL